MGFCGRFVISPSPVGVSSEALAGLSICAAVTFPDMQIQVPTNLISIGTNPRKLHSSEFRSVPSIRACQASIVCVRVDE